MNHAELILRLKKGDKAAFSDVVEQWQDMVYNTALGIVQNEEDAEDITQEVFVQVYESIGDFREEALLSTWLYKITINRALDVEKKKQRQKRGGFLRRIFDNKEVEAQEPFYHPGIALNKKEDAAVLFKAMKKLPENQRLAFMLQKIESLKKEEIAAIMNISPVAVESLQARARANLKNILQQYYEQHFK